MNHVPKKWPVRYACLLLNILVLVFLVPVLAIADLHQSVPDREVMERSIKAAKVIKKQRLEGAKRQAPGTAKLGRFIQGIVARHSDLAKTKKKGLDSTPFVEVKEGSLVQVYVSLADSGVKRLQALEEQGLAIEVVNVELKKVQGWVAIESIAALAADVNVTGISAPLYSRPRSGQFTTQGDSILGADRLRQKGFTGKGVKVGVISDGANDWHLARSTGDLPENLVTYGTCTTRLADPAKCRSAKYCNEGTAIAEIIHDIAPDADIAVAAVSTSLEFIEHINRLADEFEADVIVDDLGFYGQPYFEDGELAEAVAALPEKILYVSSAGNVAKRHYEGEFQQMNDSTYHDFGFQAGNPGDDTMGFYISADRGAYVLLQWNDPYDNPVSDYDLYVFNDYGLQTSSVWHDDTAIEGVCVYNPGPVKALRWVTVDSYSGPGKRLEMYFLGARSVEYPVSEGSIFGHPGVERVLAVGSINAEDAVEGTIASYSSCGPVRVDFPTLEYRAKPDLVAIDGVDVSGVGGFSSPFYGTSASAPHVAAVAAQLLSVAPFVKAADVKAALIKSALDLGDAGDDMTYGHGLVDAVAAEQALAKGNPVPGLLLLLGEKGEPLPLSP